MENDKLIKRFEEFWELSKLRVAPLEYKDMAKAAFLTAYKLGHAHGIIEATRKTSDSADPEIDSLTPC